MKRFALFLVASAFLAAAFVIPAKAVDENAPPVPFPYRLNIVFIGDSIGVGLGACLKDYFPNIYADAKPSRQFYQAIDIVKKLLDTNKLGSTVVIELGTNGRVMEDDLRAIIEMIGPDRKIVFVNCQVPRSWCEGDNKIYNKVIPEYPNTIIADWYTASIDNSSYFYEDGVHPNKRGLKVMAQLVADAVVKINPHQYYKPTGLDLSPEKSRFLCLLQ